MRVVYVVYSVAAAIMVQVTDVTSCSLYFSYWYSGQLAVEVRRASSTHEPHCTTVTTSSTSTPPFTLTNAACVPCVSTIQCAAPPCARYVGSASAPHVSHHSTQLAVSTLQSFLTFLFAPTPLEEQAVLLRHLDNILPTAASLQRDPDLVNHKRSVACLETLLVLSYWSMLMYYIEQVRGQHGQRRGVAMQQPCCGWWSTGRSTI